MLLGLLLESPPFLLFLTFMCMELKLTIEKLNNIITEAINVGRADFMQLITPSASVITKPQLLKYLKYRGFHPADLKRWEDLGLLAYKQDAPNCTKRYQMKDVEACFLKQMMST